MASCPSHSCLCKACLEEMALTPTCNEILVYEINWDYVQTFENVKIFSSLAPTLDVWTAPGCGNRSLKGHDVINSMGNKCYSESDLFFGKFVKIFCLYFKSESKSGCRVYGHGSTPFKG